jgi:hypothetical protein
MDGFPSDGVSTTTIFGTLMPFGAVAVDTVFEGKRKMSPTTRTRTVLIADMMVLEREVALKPARQCAPLTGCGA